MANFPTQLIPSKFLNRIYNSWSYVRTLAKVEKEQEEILFPAFKTGFVYGVREHQEASKSMESAFTDLLEAVNYIYATSKNETPLLTTSGCKKLFSARKKANDFFNEVLPHEDEVEPIGSSLPLKDENY